MKLPCLIVLASAVLGTLATGRAGDAIQPVDYRQRNDAFAPNASITPTRKVPVKDAAVQDSRVEPAVIAHQPSAIGDRRAALDVQETREKKILDKTSDRPTAQERTTSAFNHRAAPLTTGAETKKPERVARYQDSLTAASASNMARFPAVDRAATAKINRFVFRKNAPDTPTALDAAVTPAAANGGGSPTVK
jgi:hypothetical protein